ncbi:Nucleotidylyl transferase [Basidiobolus meristosporus CBS 931.73]|uniref:Nucleotidylyl transferase n=1 Tax=Basidiobolus meristosporus CBS 931.73 TaxID=1314790 RepID=A0A1Y1ZAB4_9FUNG|nr:Nucleotidylyl transferase [Basidiobolus meristosporus CBS 931.73]|eukprot:ORY06735.1 Nucleotidylyl transferase [Basidiobolus meristosporus CBS 931.73]
MTSEHVLLYLYLEKLTSIKFSTLNLVHAAVQRTTKSLTVLVDCPEIIAHQRLPVVAWEEVQSLLGTIYVDAIKAANDCGRPLLEVDVLFKDWCGYDVTSSQEITYTTWLGLAEHEQILASFNSQREKNGDKPIPVFFIPEEEVSPEKTLPEAHHIGTTHTAGSDKHYPVVAVGGTFDHLHAGHKILLSMSVWLAEERLICGISGAEMLVKKKHAHMIEPLETRMEKTLKFLRRIKPSIAYEVVPIHDTCGPTNKDPNIQAIVVSKETLPGAYEINRQRSEKNFNELDIKVIEVISNSSKALAEEELKSLKISSTQIREYLSLHSEIENL